MPSTRFRVAGSVVEIDDFDEDIEIESGDDTNVVEIPTASGAPISGRARLHNNLCPMHGQSSDGKPCAKFSHLPGNGRGIFQPNIAVRSLVIARAMVKPLVILAILFGGGFVAIHSLSHITANLVPDFAKPPVATTTVVPTPVPVHKK